MSAEIVLSIFTGEHVSQSAMNMYQVILVQYHQSCNKERKSSLSFPVINSNLRRHRWIIARIKAITPPRNEIWSAFFSAPVFSWTTKLFLLQIRSVIWLNSKSTITAFKAIITFNILSKAWDRTCKIQLQFLEQSLSHREQMAWLKKNLTFLFMEKGAGC